MNRLLQELLPTLALDPAQVARQLNLADGNALPSALPVNTLACGSVAGAALAGLALRGGQSARVRPEQVSVAFRNDQLQTIDGQAPEGFAPLSGFLEAADGWVRSHANYPHHRHRLTTALGLQPDAGRSDLAAAVRRLPAQQIEDCVTAAGGIAVRVRTRDEWRHHPQADAVRQHPLLEVTRREAASGRSTGSRAVPRPRVLDLTRVIAGPVATRTLAYLGCDVLRVDPPHLPELEAQHIDTGAAKRSTLLDLRRDVDLATFRELLGQADVLVTGYRPGALAAHGLDAPTLAKSYPGLVHAELSAWTPTGPWAERRGFDSIVQASTGISLIESTDGRTPGALPAQALDHATGYLLAAGVLTALRRRAQEGGSWHVSAHLARTAQWLLDADCTEAAVARPIVDARRWQARFASDLGTVIQSRPAFQIDDVPTEFADPPHRSGVDAPVWQGSGPTHQDQA